MPKTLPKWVSESWSSPEAEDTATNVQRPAAKFSGGIPSSVIVSWFFPSWHDTNFQTLTTGLITRGSQAVTVGYSNTQSETMDTGKGWRRATSG